MADQRRRPTPSLTVVLCFSLWFTSGQTVDFMSYFNSFEPECIEQCPAKYSTSTYGVLCYDGCEKRGYSYYWCNSRMGWDYCSPSNNIDYKGNDCRNDHPCGDYGGGYTSCIVDGIGWSKCARVEPRAMIHQTIYQKECTGECQYHEFGDYFWCYTENTWDYCSPLQDHTYRDEPCRQGSTCGTNGQSYSWCYTSYFNWDYCGVISPGECMYSQSNRRKRQADNPNLICSREDDDGNNNNNNNNNNRKVTYFIDKGNEGVQSTNRKLLDEALDLINRFDASRLTQNSRSNLVTSLRLRLDNQGICFSNNQECYNLQIQLNGQRRPGQSTTIAQITVPIGTSEEYMRLAFRESLRLQVKVEVEDENTPSTSSNNDRNKDKKCCKRRKR
ncbi:uncharacterized protein LOC118313205 [Scophthalmus maximus]|uniref:uncharacterized protein LOC118313205 n=1 Tax=Scophthalmus maximus TaxID=52904 RepID=UPI001FA8713D|nr:uncharacterized protein LOC118313205 [Scophthalmus maximus]